MAFESASGNYLLCVSIQCSTDLIFARNLYVWMPSWCLICDPRTHIVSQSCRATIRRHVTVARDHHGGPITSRRPCVVRFRRFDYSLKPIGSTISDYRLFTIRSRPISSLSHRLTNSRVCPVRNPLRFGPRRPSSMTSVGGWAIRSRCRNRYGPDNED